MNRKNKLQKTNRKKQKLFYFWKVHCGFLQSGFTIVEILAVIVVFIAIGSIAAAVFFTSLRVVNKSNSLASLRENGNYALSQMTKMIRYAVTFGGISTDGITYSNVCYAGPITSVKNVPSTYLKITSFDNNETVFHCIPGANGNVASNSASLLDTAIVKKIDACSFSCSQENEGDPPTILINLTISETGLAGINEKNTTLPLQTSVTFRNQVAQ
jgi:type II secretory pathway pseudopilin PulG